MAVETKHLSIPLLLPTEGDCASCVERWKEILLKTKGIISAEVDINASRLILNFDPAILSLESLEKQAKETGIEVAQQFNHQSFRLGGLDCPDCAVTLEHGLSRLPGVIWAAVSVPASKMLVEYDAAAVGPEKISQYVFSVGYSVVGIGAGETLTFSERLQKNRRILITCLCGLLSVTGWLCSLLGGADFSHWTTGFYLAAVAAGGYSILRGAVGSIRARSLDMNALMSIAVLGAIIIGHSAEAAAVVFLFAFGNYLEGHTMERTRRSLESLMKLAPERARVKRGEGEEVLPAERIKVSDVIVIMPGERIPLDGEVIKGASSLDESLITGESIPVQKAEGEQVWAGSINQYGSLEVRVTRPASDSTLARIFKLIENAEVQKLPAQRVIDRFAGYYTPVVIFIALTIALLPPILLGQDIHSWVYRALTLLVVSCPCALVIATPVAVVAALAAAAREGVLVKGGVYLEQAAGLQAFALDKTGTLTYGRPEVTDVIGIEGHSSEETLAFAAAIENRSEHHLARAVMELAAKEGVRPMEIAHFQALPGIGAKAQIDHRICYVGSPKIAMQNSEVAAGVDRLASEGKTTVVVMRDEAPIGLIAFADKPRSEAKGVIARLKSMGIPHLTMLTGDNSQTARAIALSIGLENWSAELLPQEKVSQVNELVKQWKNVAMVGDGINDAPALAASSIGIAMGGAGTDIALETADVVLMGDDLSKLPYLVELGRRTISVMKQNITLSVLVKTAFVLMAIPGWLTLWLAVIGDTGVSLLVMLNGMRLLYKRA